MENNPVSCKLKIPKDLDAKAPVFLVEFANCSVNLHHADKLKFHCYRQVDDKNESSRARRVLVANSGILNYESLSSDKSKDDRKNYNYYVGVRNKTSGRMKVYDSVSFRLKPVINSSILSSKSETKNFKERTEDLAMNFGSKETKRSMTARQRYAMKCASLDDAKQDISLTDTVNNANHSLSLPNSSSNIDYMPPQNCDAQTVDEVYEISNIISTVEDEHLDEKAKELLQDRPIHLKQWKMDGTYCEYVINYLEERDVTHLKAKYLIYLNYLVIFSKLLSSDIKKKDPAPLIPEPIKSCMLDRFTNTSVSDYGKFLRNFPQKMKDKLLAYILVLALIIDEYYVNLAQVQKGTKYGLPKITNVAQALGCHIHRSTINTHIVPIAELKLPLFVLQKNKKF